LMIRNIRKSMVEYHDILYDIGYAKTWDVANLYLEELYSSRAPIGDFFIWRDDRVMDEVHWYGWEIDYWMEGGLLRDMFSHGITTEEHFKMIMDPVNNHRHDLEEHYATHVAPGVADGSIGPVYDRNCANGFITDGCAPKAVISAERLRDHTLGPIETAKIANVLLEDDRTGDYVIAPEAWDCIWDELIVKKKGLKIIDDRPEPEEEYNFSEEMLDLMVHELERLITKYSGPDWNTKATANRVVELLSEHLILVQIELDELNSGRRKLLEKDILGPKERQRRRQLTAVNKNETRKERKDYTEHFNSRWKKASTGRGKAQSELILSEARRKVEAAVKAGKMEEFTTSISNSMSQIRMLEASSKIDHSSTLDSIQKLKEMAVKAESYFGSFQ